MADPVMFKLPGLNENTDTNNSGFNSPSGEGDEKMTAYKIPPVIWIPVLLIGGYLITRYALEEG